ncbi:hypothetical protein MRX96_048098 [Rhipicephalus microplus]
MAGVEVDAAAAWLAAFFCFSTSSSLSCLDGGLLGGGTGTTGAGGGSFSSRSFSACFCFCLIWFSWRRSMNLAESLSFTTPLSGPRVASSVSNTFSRGGGVPRSGRSEYGYSALLNRRP